MTMLLAADLPAPPFLKHWFLEVPLVPSVILLVAATLVWVMLNRRGAFQKGTVIAAGLVAVAAGIYLVGTVVETERETLTDRTAKLVNAIMEADRAAASELLGDQLVMSTAGKSFVTLDRDWMLDVIGGFDRHQVSSSSFRWTGATLDGPNVARTQFKGRVSSSIWGGPHATTWDVAWRRDASGTWRVSGLDWLTYFGERPDRAWMSGLASPRALR